MAALPQQLPWFAQELYVKSPLYDTPRHALPAYGFPQQQQFHQSVLESAYDCPSFALPDFGLPNLSAAGTEAQPLAFDEPLPVDLIADGFLDFDLTVPAPSAAAATTIAAPWAVPAGARSPTTDEELHELDYDWSDGVSADAELSGEESSLPSSSARASPPHQFAQQQQAPVSHLLSRAQRQMEGVYSAPSVHPQRVMPLPVPAPQQQQQQQQRQSVLPVLKKQAAARDPRTMKHACSYCGLKFRGHTDMLRHERRHTGEKPFSCDHCDKTFRQKSTLRTHTRIHTDEKPFACAKCGMAFRHRNSFNRHVTRCA